ncbi:MAG: hypothetical protein U0X20_17305 [Caldilineaceae bacterium]
MAPQQPDYYAYDRRVQAQAQASSSWASAFKLFLILAAVAAFVWVLYFAFDKTGLQFALIALFVIGVALLVWFLMLKTHQQVSDTHADAVNNIVRFQGEDDLGETLRALAAAAAGTQRSATQFDGRLLAVANMIGAAKAKGEIAAIEAKQTIDAHRQQIAQSQQQGEQQRRQAFYSYAADQQAANSDQTNPYQAGPPPDQRRSRGSGFNVYE